MKAQLFTSRYGVKFDETDNKYYVTDLYTSEKYPFDTNTYAWLFVHILNRYEESKYEPVKLVDGYNLNFNDTSTSVYIRFAFREYVYELKLDRPNLVQKFLLYIMGFKRIKNG